ncbi:MAG: hypothetical protein E6J72_16580 [Deltaproteobacteria bacterium]|nr:MAG: hypothetical protein E6J72_16580 [Deltaproteobacteria bacterium]
MRTWVLVSRARPSTLTRMTWMSSLDGWWTVAAIGGAVGAAFLWWALADLFLASVELPFSAMLERWRARRVPRDERDGDADALASA